MVCNFKTETTIHPNVTNPAEKDHKPITYTICSMKQWSWNGNVPACICDSEENCVFWMSSSHKKELLMKMKRERYEKDGVIFDENGCCIHCGWSITSRFGCPKCKPHKKIHQREKKP